ncbi:hypothetical protein MBANPS3_012471 [Mucor bainieri]
MNRAARDWLIETHSDRNGLPEFFRAGEYSFASKSIAEEDYITTVDDIARDGTNAEYQEWARNIQANEYMCLYNSLSLDYWRYLAGTEQDKLAKDKAAGILVTPSARKERITKKPKSNYVSSDTLFIDGYRQSLGTIIGRYARSYLSTSNKSSYFKVLGMNNIIDLSDMSDASHLNLFSSKAQADIQKLFSADEWNEGQHDGCEVPEAIIKKFFNEQNVDKFLSKVSKEIEEAMNVDKINKRIYVTILESLLYDKYLYDEEGLFSETDLIVKIYGPILENVFKGSGLRLTWGDTISPFSDSGSRMDLRVFHGNRLSPDIMVNEFAKASKESKYYYDKTKSVLVSLAHLKKHVKQGNMDLEAAKELVIPFIITQGLEGDVYYLRVIDKEWCAIQKLTDMDLPTNITDIKEHKIAEYIEKLFMIKSLCSGAKTITTAKRRSQKSLHRYNRKVVKMDSFFKKEVWKDSYEHEFSDSEEEI